MRRFFIFLACLTGILAVRAEETMLLDEIEIVAPIKEEKEIAELPVSSNSFTMTEMERGNATSSRDLTATIPNFHLPDYGSQTTSSIYVRGFGARIDNPVVSLLVDNIPVFNKSAFDTDLFDLQRAEFLRGPQGTLYGRNTLCGLIHYYTLSPFAYQGTRLSASYSTGCTVNVKASTYHKVSDRFAFSVAANFKHTNGLFENEYKNELCDLSNGGTLRSRQIWKVRDDFTIDNSVTFGLLKQGGYAYALMDSNEVRQPIRYNDECHYIRKMLTDGLVMRWEKSKYTISSATSYQFLKDDMLLDNDFLPVDYFTLNQRQNSHTVTEEVFLRSKRPSKVWNWKTGLWGFFTHNTMNAPVVFKRDGIENLILSNANKGMQSVFPTEYIDIRENSFEISSDFKLPMYGLAAYHQSDFRVGKWNFTLGLRVDYEHQKMNYHSQADVHYLFSMLMSDYKAYTTLFEGEQQQDYLEFLPKISVQYFFNERSHVYAYAAKGYKAGGYNTQIFSDILQNRMMNGLMGDMGIKMDAQDGPSYDDATATAYKPEYSWTYELGTHLSFLPEQRLTLDLTTFYISCKDQQLTVFPSGSAGRMMTNAGKSRSLGAEFSLRYRVNNWNLTGAYGYTNAKFVEYNDGNQDYKGNALPYSPRHTASLGVQYNFVINRRCLDNILLSVDGKGVGPIYWDESNTVKQSFYPLLDAMVTLRKGDFELKGWGKNLTCQQYDTFYFVSMGNRFCQKGKPLQVGMTINYNF